MSARLTIRPGEPGEPALWIVDAKGRTQPTDADELGLDEELAERIEEWLDAIDASLDEGGGRALDPATHDALADAGAQIAAQARDDLGPDWEVVLDLGHLGSMT